MFNDCVFGLLNVLPKILDTALENHVLLLIVTEGSLADHQCNAFFLALAFGVAELGTYHGRDDLSNGLVLLVKEPCVGKKLSLGEHGRFAVWIYLEPLANTVNEFHLGISHKKIRISK